MPKFSTHTFSLFIALALVTTHTLASEIRISNTEFTVLQEPGEVIVYAKFTISWENAWRNNKNHDAAWIFMKARSQNGRWQHINLTEAGHRIIQQHTTDVEPELEIPKDRAGFFIYASQPYRGAVHWTVKVKLDPESFNNLNLSSSGIYWDVHGIEMVYIPEGSFFLGDPAPEALEFSSFYRSDSKGKPNGLFRITSEAAINIGPKSGNLFYTSGDYRGDASGPIPVDFPKGYNAFYIMKYEITQGEYAVFLNSINVTATHFRANFGGRDYYQRRGIISLKDGQYVADSPNRPANYLSWDDGVAFADWAGLRPFTELEFTKAARGTVSPNPNEYPWGTVSKDLLARYIDSNNELVLAEKVVLANLTDENKEVYGASFYWVMDLAGSLWERAITIGHPTGRQFKGTHGDGKLTGNGFATNEDWPKGYESMGGFGYRGGGFYEHGRKYHEFNPHSPVSYRPFGSWGGWPRHHAYGFRGARTAP